MNTLEILSKVKVLAYKWEDKVLSGGIPHYDAANAHADFKSLQNEIEASLDEQAERMHQEELERELEAKFNDTYQE